MLRLSRAMAYKNALAGLDHGGGKAVIIGDPSRDKTEPLLRAYGRFVSSLGGRYITACDVGTRSEDMDIIARECRWVTGRTTANGGAGDSSVLTAMGVMHGMRAAAEHAWGSTSLRGRTVGVEGVGKVGHRLVDHLIEAEATWSCAMSAAPPSTPSAPVIPQVRPVDGIERADRGAAGHPGPVRARRHPDRPGRRRADRADRLRRANNQLAHHGIEKLLADRGILYAPDYVVNSGGVIQVADELAGFNFERARAATEQIFATTARYCHRRRRGVPPSVAADRLAERRMADVGPAARNMAGHHGISVGIRGAKRVRLYLYGCW